MDASFVPESLHRRGRRRRLGTALAAILFALAACSSGPAATPTIPPNATGSIQPVATATRSISPSPSPAAFPATLTDDEGTTVALAKEPAKIVSRRSLSANR